MEYDFRWFSHFEAGLMSLAEDTRSQEELSDKDKAALNIIRWRSDPVSWVLHHFGPVMIEKWQAEALENVANHNFVSIRSGHGVGKTTFLSWCLLWWMSTRYPVKVACTAPSGHQLFDLLWPEVAMWLRKMPQDLQDQFEIKADKIELANGGRENFAVARTARKETPEALQGFHSEHMLYLIDEAPGIPEIIFEVAEGAMSTPGAKTVMTGNPTRTSGYFYDSHQPLKTGDDWVRMKVSCFDSTRVSPDYPERVARRWGINSNVYKVRVLGEFPTDDDDTYFSFDKIMAATQRDVEPINERPRWGVDPARFGNDRSTLCKRKGNVVSEEPKYWSKLDTMLLVGKIVAEWKEAPAYDKPSHILVDSIGIGAGVADRLRELSKQGKLGDTKVIDVNVSETAAIRDDCNRLRDELYMEAHDWLDRMDCKLPVGNKRDGDLVGEMSVIKYDFQSDGTLVIESKKMMKKRGLRSPDLLDSFVNTFAGPPARVTRGPRGMSKDQTGRTRHSERVRSMLRRPKRGR